MNFETGSLRRTLPSSSSIRTATPQTGFDIEKTRKKASFCMGLFVTAQEFLLNHLILFWQQGARQSFLAAWNVFPCEQVRQGEDLFTPSQFFQQTAQKDNTEDERGF